MTITNPSKTFFTGADPLTVVREVVGAIDEWVRIHEVEQTKRAFIHAQGQVAIEEIRAKKELFLAYLDWSFDERASNFRQLFAALDRALDEGSGDAGSILAAITTLAAKSPFADLHDISFVQAALTDPDHEWEV